MPTDFEETLVECARPGSYSSVCTILAVVDAIGYNINAVHPHVIGSIDVVSKILTRTHSPLTENNSHELSLMWTRLRPMTINTWLPDHYVPLITCTSNAHSNTHVSTPQKTEETPANVPADQSTIEIHSGVSLSESVSDIGPFFITNQWHRKLCSRTKQWCWKCTNHWRWNRHWTNQWQWEVQFKPWTS